MISRVLAPSVFIALVPLALGACGGEGPKCPATATAPSAVPPSPPRPPEVPAAKPPVAPASHDDEVLGPPHAFGFDDMIAMRRIEDLTASPDGTKIAYTIKTPDVATNKSAKDVWVQNVDGTSARRLTDHPGADHSPRFAPDGKSVLFLSERSGTTQVWRVNLEGSETTQVTSLPIDVAGMVGSSRVDLQACKLEYSIVSPK